MSEVKIVLQSLCEYLNLLLETNLKPEHFRSAKFDHKDLDAINELWNTLYKLCNALGPIALEENKESLPIWVQLNFVSRGYTNVSFYGLPSDKSSGGRELLLALSWLLAQENVLAELTKEFLRQSLLCQEYLDNKTSNRNSMVFHSTNNASTIKREAAHCVNYALWLATHIKYNLNHIIDAEQERIKNTYKVHESTLGSSGLPHLSVTETKLVSDSLFLEKLMPHLSNIVKLIELHTKWTKKKLIFWEWMDSVLELKQSSDQSQRHTAEQERILENFLETLSSYSKRGYTNQENLSKSIDKKTFTPRFLLSSGVAKSSNALIRKASSSDLLADVSNSDNGVVSIASDLLLRIESELQDVDKHRQDKLEELHLVVKEIADNLGLIIVGDALSLENESEDCSK